MVHFQILDSFYTVYSYRRMFVIIGNTDVSGDEYLDYLDYINNQLN